MQFALLLHSQNLKKILTVLEIFIKAQKWEFSEKQDLYPQTA